MILIFKHIKLLHLKHVISPKIPVNDQSVTDFNINYRDLAKCHGYGRYIREEILGGNILIDHEGMCFTKKYVFHHVIMCITMEICVSPCKRAMSFLLRLGSSAVAILVPHSSPLKGQSDLI